MKKASYRGILLFTFLLLLLTLKAINDSSLLMRNAETQQIRLYLEQAADLQNSSPARALELIDQALNMAKNNSQIEMIELLARCYNQKGIIHTINANYLEALENYNLALEAYKTLKTISKEKAEHTEGRANILANIGAIYYHKHNLPKALDYWLDALGQISKLQSPDSEAQLLNNIGIVYFEMKQPEKALEYYNQALDIFLVSDNEEGIAMCYTNIGEIYGHLGYYSKALELLEKSKAIKIKTDNIYGLLQCVLTMAELTLKMNEYTKAIEFANEANILAVELEAKKDMLKSFELLSRAYAATKNYKPAYQNQLMYQIINDSIFSEEKNNLFNEMQSEYEEKLRQNEIEILKQQEKHQRTVKKILMIALVTIAVVSALLIASLIARKRKEKALHLKDNQLLEKEKILVSTQLEKQEMANTELNREIEFKTRQLTSHALNIMQKNKMLQELEKTIGATIKSVDEQAKGELRKLKNLVKQNLKTDKDWEVFKLYFEQINKDFFVQLMKINSELSPHDIRHCALIQLNLNIKETASLLNLSPNSIKSARYRLKKKLNLQPEDDLLSYLRNL